MGIQGLLPFLKKASRQASIKEFKGCTVAIDSYCWLHRGSFACAEKLARGESTDQYVFYCMKYVNNLLYFGLKPIMVFDGCHLPSKKEVEKTRRERREINRKKAAQLLREGKRSEARDCLTKCIDITSQMALELMNACRDKGVDCIVAPYEADAQLAYLSKTGIAQVVITEDSDLIIFGCERVMFKMDIAGNGILIEQRNINRALEMRADLYTFEKFRYMCILSGCDYLPSLPGIGLAKASKALQRTRQTDIRTVIKKLPSILNMGSLTVTEEYIVMFIQAYNTFLYQLVFDPMLRKLVPLTPYSSDIDPSSLSYAGSYMEPAMALQIAYGNIDIHTGARIASFDPALHKPKSRSWNDDDFKYYKDGRPKLHMLSIWSKSFRPKANHEIHTEDAVEKKDSSTRGMEVTVKVGGFRRNSSPVKRPYNDEEDATMKNVDLATLYSHKGTPVHSDAKRAKIETDNKPFDDGDPFNATRQNVNGAISYEDIRKANNTSAKDREDREDREEAQKKSPRNIFAVGAYRASQRKGQFSLDISESEVATEAKDIEEAQKKSPRNIFTAGASQRKEQFSLNRSESKIETEVNDIVEAQKKSPRNIFAVGASQRKGRFSLNGIESEVETEVKSRFFVASKPHRKSIFFEHLDKDGVTSKTVETSSDITPSLRCDTIQKPSPCRNFTSNLARFHHAKPVTNTKQANSQFKPVLPSIDIDQHRLTERTDIQMENSQVDTDDSCAVISQNTSLYSIDTDSISVNIENDTQLSPSQSSRQATASSSQPLHSSGSSPPSASQSKSSDWAWSCKLDNDTQSSYFKQNEMSVTEYPSSCNSSQENHVVDDTPIKVQQKTPTSAKVPRGGCRSSGLSRQKIKKEASSEKTSIKNFFTQFRMEKRSPMSIKSVCSNKDNFSDTVDLT